MQGPLWCRMMVQTFMKIVWTSFEKFETSMKGREKKKQKQKNDTNAYVVENFFDS